MATASPSTDTASTAGARNSGPVLFTAPPAIPSSLAELLQLDAATLGRLYAGARVPDLAAIHGDLRGRMLAWPGLGATGNGLLRALASSDSFPWRGKSFTALGDGHGEGRNRVVSDRFKVFRFETSVGPSRAGAFDAVQLDYDLPENPFFIRAIKDEIRELSPDLYLGQAWLRAGGKETLVLYFALQAA